MIDLFYDFYRNKRVLVTGHTGFKGSWLSIWLKELGAEVYGVSLEPYSNKENFCLSGLAEKICADIRADIRDISTMNELFDKIQPEIVFHLAAQPIVLHSYEYPVETYETNVMGTINVMEAIRHTSSVKVGIMVTSDKCYENSIAGVCHTECDPMGGYDPYSSSKGACEIAIQSWRQSYFNPQKYYEHRKSIASVRSGNVIGGGDWAKDRLIPDCARAIEANKYINIRSPRSVRPWGFILDTLYGYLLLAKKMWEAPTSYCESWNFGPSRYSVFSTWDIASKFCNAMGIGNLRKTETQSQLFESPLLLIDATKAKERLGWYPLPDIDLGIFLVADWYRKYQKKDVYELCVSEIEQYISFRGII